MASRTRTPWWRRTPRQKRILHDRANPVEPEFRDITDYVDSLLYYLRAEEAALCRWADLGPPPRSTVVRDLDA